MSSAELSNRLYSIKPRGFLLVNQSAQTCIQIYTCLWGDHGKQTGEQEFFGGVAQKILCRCEWAGEKALDCTAVS